MVYCFTDNWSDNRIWFRGRR